MAALQNVKGTWGGLPDFGLTELFNSARGTTQNPTYNNPAVYAQTGRPLAQNTSTIPGIQPGGNTYVNKTPSIQNQQTQQSQPQAPAGFNTRDAQGANVGDQRNGMRWTGAQWEPLGGSAAGGAPAFDQAAYDNQLNASYAPAFQQADDVEAQYRAEYPTSQEFINNSYDQVMPQLQSQQDTQLGGLNTQAAKGKAEGKNQIAKSRQTYNELKQGGLTRFGGSSSTGEAYGELLGRKTQEQLGGINQNSGQLQMDIEKERANTNAFFADKKASLEKEKQLKLQELKNSFDDEIRKINSVRTGLESEKAAKRMAAIQEFSVQARQAQYDAQVFNQKLNAWKAAKDEAVQLATKFQAKSFSIPGMPNVMGGMSFTGTNNGPATQSNYIQGQGAYTPEDLDAMGLTPTGFNSKTGAMSYGISKNDDWENL